MNPSKRVPIETDKDSASRAPLREDKGPPSRFVLDFPRRGEVERPSLKFKPGVPSLVPALTDVLKRLSFGELVYLGEVGPGTFAYASRQAMHRVRAYHAAVLTPHAGRGPPQELLLVGHLHTSDGQVTRVEGFNGQEGQRWAERARDELAKSGLLPADAAIVLSQPLRDCLHAKNMKLNR